MTSSPLYTPSSDTAAPVPARPTSTSSYSNASTVTRSTLLTNTYVNTVRNARSASVSSANFNSVNQSPFSPTGGNQHLPTVDSYNNNTTAPSEVCTSPDGATPPVQYVEYADMQSVMPPEVFPAAAASPGRLPASNLKEDRIEMPPPSNLSFQPSPKKSVNDSLHKTQKASPMGLSPDDDSCRPRSLSAGAASLKRPSNLYITTPRRAAGGDPAAVDSMTSDGKSLGSPIKEDSVKPSPASPESLPSPPQPTSSQRPPMDVPSSAFIPAHLKAISAVPVVTSSFTPKEEGTIVGYENCLSVQQPSVLKGLETEA